MLASSGGVLPVVIGPHGIRVEGTLHIDDWRSAIRNFNGLKNRWISGMADLIEYGRRSYGPETVAEELNQLGLAIEDEQRCLALGQLTLDFREEHGLTTEHYYVLAKGNLDPLGRERWAKQAKDLGLSASELKKSIAAGRIMRDDPAPGGGGKGPTGIQTIQGILFHLRAWEKKVGGREVILSWPRNQRQELLEEVKPFLDLLEELKAATEMEA